MTLHEKGVIAIDEYLRENPSEKGKLKTRKEVYEIMHKYYSEITIDKNNVPPTDICWNSVNNKPGSKIFDDFEHWPHALESVDGSFKLLGTDFLYTGDVRHAGLKILFARWKDGVYERIVVDDTRAVDVPENLKIRLQNLYEGIKAELDAAPVTVRINGTAVEVNYQELLLCGVNVEQETYKLYNASSDWTDITTYHCEEMGDGTWFYYLDTIDECIGESQRLVVFETQKE